MTITFTVCYVKPTGKLGYRTFDCGHIHCTRCGRIARKFRKGWTCGFGCIAPEENQ